MKSPLDNGTRAPYSTTSQYRAQGSNAFGQLGDGNGGPTDPQDDNPCPNCDQDWNNQTSPVTVSFDGGIIPVSVSAGTYNTCAILENGSVMCWGRGVYGLNGDGFNNTSYDNDDEYLQVLVSLPEGINAIDVEIGTWHACAIMDNGSLYCWGGTNTGSLELKGAKNAIMTTCKNSTGCYPFPRYLDLGDRVPTSLSLGETFTCALMQDGGVQCWGGSDSSNIFGELGNGESGGSQNGHGYGGGSAKLEVSDAPERLFRPP